MSDDSRANFTTQTSPVYFASGIEAAANMWVLTLAFLAAGHGPQGLTEVPQASVSIPWPLAKAIKTTLEKAINDYEAQQGVISLPRGFDVDTTRVDK